MYLPDALPFTVQTPSRENGTAERPQAFRCPKLKNYFSAIDAQSERGAHSKSFVLHCRAAVLRGRVLLPAQSGFAWGRIDAFCKIHRRRGCSLLPPKENQKSASDFDALDPRTRGCSPLVTPKRKSNRKKSSRFAQRFFLGSPSKTPQPLRRQLPKWGAGLAGPETLHSSRKLCRHAKASPFEERFPPRRRFRRKRARQRLRPLL